MELAMTGGTGFVGGRLIALALARGHTVRALTRKASAPRAGVTWIAGALDNTESLAALCAGADAVIHVAGVVNGDRETFFKGNVEGTANMVAAAEGAGVKRFVHVSSMAAREPELSVYGQSKLEAETPVKRFSGDWTMVRPPAIYGPGDKEMLEFFKAAKLGVVPLPPGGRLSLIHADDLCGLLLDCLDKPESYGKTYELDDGTPNGWSHADFARAIGRSIGKSILPVALPRAVMNLGARIDKALRGTKAKLTPDRVAYFCHPDWTAHADRQPPATVWTPAIPTPAGLAATAAWYRANGLL